MIELIAASSILISIVLLGLYTFEVDNEKRAIFTGSLTLFIFSLIYLITENYIAAIVQISFASSILTALIFTSFEAVRKTNDKNEYPVAASLTIVLLMVLFPLFIGFKRIKTPLPENWFSLIFFITISVIFVTGFLVISNILARLKK
ncbi:MAG: hypothetical protein J7K23_05275 [Thermoproteales archaeon]|nr:hypothetical protein [Thermoproteales archaeon]